MDAQGPHSHILLMRGGESPRDIFGSEILAKGDFFGSMEDAGIFLVVKKHRDFLGILHFFI